jgi:hypothetical protein
MCEYQAMMRIRLVAQCVFGSLIFATLLAAHTAGLFLDREGARAGLVLAVSSVLTMVWVQWEALKFAALLAQGAEAPTERTWPFWWASQALTVASLLLLVVGG